MRRHIILAVSLAAGCGRGGTPAPTPTEVRAVRVEGPLPRTDGRARAWRSAPEHVERLLPQDVTEPKLARAGVSAVRVRALHDGSWIAFRLEWDDPSRDVIAGPGRFSDAAAVQLPLVRGSDVPDPAMGLAGKPVQILFWRASWQETRDPVAALRPNASIDHYPYQAAKGEGRAELERQYAPAKNVGNPMTVRPNGAVQALVAEGFGTLSPAGGQEVRGAGAWHDRTWSVVLARPLGDPQTTPLVAGARTYVAFAIWDGSAGDVGARKMRSVWVPLELAPAQPVRAAVAQ